jgi:hypothetical protein
MIVNHYHYGLWILVDIISEEAERAKNEEKNDSGRELRLDLLRKIREFAALLFWTFDEAKGKVVPLPKQIMGFENVDTTSNIPEDTDP